MELYKIHRSHFNTPVRAGKRGGSGKKREAPYGGLLWAAVFALNPLKTSRRFGEPFDVLFTLCVRLWCGLDEGYVNQTHKVPNRALDLSLYNAVVAYGTLEQIVMNYKQANLAQDEHRDC